MKRYTDLSKLSQEYAQELCSAEYGVFLLSFKGLTPERLARASRGYSAEALRLLAGKCAVLATLATAADGTRRYAILPLQFSRADYTLLRAGTFSAAAVANINASRGGANLIIEGKKVICNRCGLIFDTVAAYREHHCNDHRPRCHCGAILRTPKEKAAGRCTACAVKKAAEVNGYHCSPHSSCPLWVDARPRNSVLHFGAEVEIGGSATFNSRSSVPELSGIINADPFAPYMEFERDGSIDGGVECITRPTTWAEVVKYRDALNTFYVKAREVGGTFDRVNGLHIHIDRQYLSNPEAAAYIEFFIYHNFGELSYISGRAANTFGYTRPKNGKNVPLARTLLTHNNRVDRYNAVNVSNSETVEVRLFGGHIDTGDDFLAVVDMVQALAKWAKRATILTASRASLSSLLPYIKDARNVLRYIEKIEGATYTKPVLTATERARLDAFKKELRGRCA